MYSLPLITFLSNLLTYSIFQVTANSWESGLFILFLVFFAIIAAGYVLKKVSELVIYLVDSVLWPWFVYYRLLYSLL